MSISEPMPVSEPFRRVELFTGEGRRRSWTPDEKAAIVAESYGDGETVCGVARRHGLTPQQLFTWRRLTRRVIQSADTPMFVPAVVKAQPPSPTPSKPRRSRRQRSAKADIEFEIDGVMVRVGSGASAKTIAAVISALKAGS